MASLKILREKLLTPPQCIETALEESPRVPHHRGDTKISKPPNLL